MVKGENWLPQVVLWILPLFCTLAQIQNKLIKCNENKGRKDLKHLVTVNITSQNLCKHEVNVNYKRVAASFSLKEEQWFYNIHQDNKRVCKVTCRTARKQGKRLWEHSQDRKTLIQTT